VCSLREEERGKAVIYGPSSHQINSTTQVQQVHKGPRIRLTARKQVPQVFEKFTWNSAQAKSGSPSQNSASSEEYSPIRGDPKAQAHDPIWSPALDPGLFNTNSIRGSLQACDLVRVFAQALFVQGLTRVTHPYGPICPFSNWVWTRNPNLGFSSPSEVRFRPFKRRYDQYSEENYFGGYPNPHFCYKRFQRGESSQSSRGDQAYPRGNPYKYQGRHYYP
jgi:hypothetical protein